VTPRDIHWCSELSCKADTRARNSSCRLPSPSVSVEYCRSALHCCITHDLLHCCRSCRSRFCWTATTPTWCGHHPRALLHYTRTSHRIVPCILSPNPQIQFLSDCDHINVLRCHQPRALLHYTCTSHRIAPCIRSLLADPVSVGLQPTQRGALPSPACIAALYM
jgi:hypothetical protein